MNMTTIEQRTPVTGVTPPVMEAITLRVENGRWVAEYSSPGVVALYGTCRMPTAFTSEVSHGEVATAMQERWPGMWVIVEGQGVES